jgi:hypothetical protein
MGTRGHARFSVRVEEVVALCPKKAIQRKARLFHSDFMILPFHPDIPEMGTIPLTNNRNHSDSFTVSRAYTV